MEIKDIEERLFCFQFTAKNKSGEIDAAFYDTDGFIKIKLLAIDKNDIKIGFHIMKGRDLLKLNCNKIIKITSIYFLDEQNKISKYGEQQK